MKKIGIALVVLFLSLNTCSQNRNTTNTLFELQKKKVEIDINKNLFSNVSTNMYVSQNPDALILALFIPISYDKQKEKITSKPLTKGMVFKGEKVLNNDKVLFVEGTVFKKGIEFAKRIYYIPQRKNICIELTTMLAVDASDAYKKMMVEIVNSVIEKN